MAKDLLSLEGKVALITGGASGIGLGAARSFASHGARLGIVGRNEEEVRACVEEFRRAGHEAEALVADVSDAEAMADITGRLVTRFGRLDIVFANAGVNGVWAAIEDITPEEFDTTVRINLRGTFLTIKYAVPHLKRQGGAVLVTSSVNGTRMFSNTGATVYSATKAAQVAMVKMLAIELAQQRIRVNAICPGAISTNIGENTEARGLDELRIPVHFPAGEIPLTGGEPGDIEQVGHLALFLASDMASHITGEVVFIDGAQSLLQG